MLRSRQIMPLAFLAASIGLAAFLATNSNASILDVAAVMAFGVAIASIAYIWLPNSRAAPATSRIKVPLWLRILFACYGAAWGFATLIAIVTLPWVGTRGFEFFFGGEHSWTLLLLGALFLPIVRWRLR